MVVSTRGRYAIRVMLDLAENGGTEKYIAMKEVAQRQDISLKYLEKILPVLVENNLIEGVHGRGGGYKLVRKPEEYIVGEILRLTEGSLAPVSCLECENDTCDRADTCKTRDMWSNLFDLINNYFDNITLADLLKKGSNIVDI